MVLTWPVISAELSISVAQNKRAETNESSTAREWVQKVQDLLRSKTSIARYTMRIETQDWQREVRLDAWDDRLNNRFFIRILAPPKDRNTTWLKVGGNLWMYLPKLERDIRIPPSMMLTSWMGSDFTNDDLVKMESMVQDYTHRILSREGDRLVIESIPKPDVAVVWGKIIHTLRTDGIPLSDDYYDEHGRHVRHLRFDQVRVLGGRRIPSRWTMQPLSGEDANGKRTIMLLESIKFDVPIEQRIFSRRHLRSSANDRVK
ncbi:MAG: outer membrane lipoprotein-sorting protein [Gammaproteobacteria bacterium]|nr:MAG: outer membrane lipoprotein-sorting protein [Gammaproteobacteria bacterium]